MSSETVVGSTLVDETIAGFEARLVELQPHVDEAREITRAIKSLRGRTGSRGRNPERANEFVELVNANPGSTVAEIATLMGLDKPNYLYRVASKAVDDGLVIKDGKTYQPVSA